MILIVVNVYLFRIFPFDRMKTLGVSRGRCVDDYRRSNILVTRIGGKHVRSSESSL